MSYVLNLKWGLWHQWVHLIFASTCEGHRASPFHRRGEWGREAMWITKSQAAHMQGSGSGCQLGEGSHPADGLDGRAQDGFEPLTGSHCLGPLCTEYPPMASVAAWLVSDRSSLQTVAVEQCCTMEIEWNLNFSRNLLLNRKKKQGKIFSRKHFLLMRTWR